MNKGQGSVVLGMLLCWLLNLVQIGIAILLLAAGERDIPSVYVLLAGMGLLQIAYVVPLYRLLRRKAKPRAATGLIIAASITALLTIACDWAAFGGAVFRSHF
jgi:hypothetical protein